MVDAGSVVSSLGAFDAVYVDGDNAPCLATDIVAADTMPDGWQRWVEWHRAIAPDNLQEITALEADRGRYLGYVRLVGRKRADAVLNDPVVSVPVEYRKAPLLRGHD